MWTTLTPLPLVMPLLGAAVVSALGILGMRRFVRVVSLVAALGVAVLGVGLAWHSLQHGPTVAWIGDWQPDGGHAVGVALVGHPIGAALVALAGVLVLAAVVCTPYLIDDDVGHGYHALLLVFLAGLCGLALAADIFTMFVFYELMSVCVFSLIGLHVRRRSSIQGAVSFAIANSIGAVLMLMGIGMVYAQTDALNLADIGTQLSGHHGAPVVTAAGLALVLVGYLVKAAIVPMHAWLAAAYTAAPAPICAVMSGMMSSIGVYAVAEIFWTAFAPGTGASEHAALQVLLSVLGTATVFLGGAMALLEADLKRTLAFATIAQAGIILLGVATLDTAALGGSMLYLVSDGLLKGAAFVLVGSIALRFGTVDELSLRGRLREVPMSAAALCVIALFGFAACPPFGPFAGKSMLSDASTAHGFGWISWVVAAGGALTSGALIRATVRGFGGFGAKSTPWLVSQGDDPQEGDSTASLTTEPRRGSVVSLITALVLIVAGLSFAAIPHVRRDANIGATWLVDQRAYTSLVLKMPATDPHRIVARSLPPTTSEHSTRLAVLMGVGEVFVALLLAAGGLWPRVIFRGSKWLTRAVHRPVQMLHALHGGYLGDDIAWLVFGAGLCGAVLTLGAVQTH